LHKLIHNIFQNPQDEKFRILKKSNNAIKQKLMSVEPKDKMLELVEALGYTYLDEEMHVFVGDYFVNLSVGAHMIETEVMKLKMLSMSDEERKKQELIMKNREEYLAKQKADRELKKKLEEYS